MSVDVGSLSVKELKKELGARGISFADCFEKSDLRRKLQAALDAAPAPAAAGETKAPAASSSSSAASNPGSFSKETIGAYECYTAIFGPKKASPDLCCIFMHGYGASADQFTDIFTGLYASQPSLAGLTLAAICPQAPSGAGGQPEWWPLDLMQWQMAMMGGEAAVAKMIRDEPAGMATTRGKVCDLIAAVAAAQSVPLSRVVVGGFSQGSMAAIDVALVGLDENLGGVIALSSFPLTVDTWAAKCKAEHAGLRVLQTHGIQDPLLPYASSGWLRDLLKTNGAEVTYETHGGQHDIGDPQKAFSQIAAFLASTPGLASKC